MFDLLNANPTTVPSDFHNKPDLCIKCYHCQHLMKTMPPIMLSLSYDSSSSYDEEAHIKGHETFKEDNYFADYDDSMIPLSISLSPTQWPSPPSHSSTPLHLSASTNPLVPSECTSGTPIKRQNQKPRVYNCSRCGLRKNKIRAKEENVEACICSKASPESNSLSPKRKRMGSEDDEQIQTAGVSSTISTTSTTLATTIPPPISPVSLTFLNPTPATTISPPISLTSLTSLKSLTSPTTPTVEKFKVCVSEKTEVALGGLDPISYFIGSGSPVRGIARFSKIVYFGLDGDAAIFRFATKENMAQFSQSPFSYLPAFGGYCAVFAMEKKAVAGDPLSYKIQDGRLLLFYSGSHDAPGLSTNNKEVWERNPQENLLTADSNWDDVEGVDEGFVGCVGRGFFPNSKI